jgi:hypothetical protein
MPTPNRAVQIDQMPREYDQGKVQRVLESAVRQLTDAPPEDAKESRKKDVPLPVDLLRWCL